jgi:hypothetical protein
MLGQVLSLKEESKKIFRGIIMIIKLTIVVIAVLVFGLVPFSYAGDPTLDWMDAVRKNIDQCFQNGEITKEEAHALRTELADLRASIGRNFDKADHARVGKGTSVVNDKLPKTCR